MANFKLEIMTKKISLENDLKRLNFHNSLQDFKFLIINVIRIIFSFPFTILVFPLKLINFLFGDSNWHKTKKRVLQENFFALIKELRKLLMLISEYKLDQYKFCKRFYGIYKYHVNYFEDSDFIDKDKILECLDRDKNSISKVKEIRNHINMIEKKYKFEIYYTKGKLSFLLDIFSTELLDEKGYSNWKKSIFEDITNLNKLSKKKDRLLDKFEEWNHFIFLGPLSVSKDLFQELYKNVYINTEKSNFIDLIFNLVKIRK